MFKRALISVSDKNQIEKLGHFLSQQGCEIVSTGGSAKLLREAGVSVLEVSELTGFPEVMGGRVKTLHPKIHMGLLARTNHPDDLKTLEEQQGVLFDLVVVNLYPFEESLKRSASLSEQVEQIDIGGPTLLRAAAKSFDRITVLSHPRQYASILSGQLPDLESRRQMAAEAFSHVSTYDSMVSAFLSPQPGPDLSFGGHQVRGLRYGENPHQKGWWYSLAGTHQGWHQAEILQGKELSYNNLLDLDAAQRCLAQLDSVACVVVKHNNPCGVAVGESLLEAVDQALKADPVSCFGGIVAVNHPLDESVAKRLSEVFLECVVAPKVSEAAQEVFKKKKNQRVLIYKGGTSPSETQEQWKFTSIEGGFLLQSFDQPLLWSDQWKVLGETDSLTPQVKKDLSLAWLVCANLKSNAISLVSDGKTCGLGMGQVSRVDAVDQAISRLQKFHPQAKNVVAASDAFFPFPDSIEKLAAAGVEWVIQPGGSIKDQEVIERAQELGVNLVFTGQRHFRH